MREVSGFSKFTKVEKIDWLASQFSGNTKDEIRKISDFWHTDLSKQDIFDEFSENTISNFYMPFGVAPNVLINNKLYCVPMVIEESSVVAAACKASKFWLQRGGFNAEVISTTKVGHVHLTWNGDKEKFKDLIKTNEQSLLNDLLPLSVNMRERGGGVTSLELLDCTDKLEDFYKVEVKFETCDAMGANFINTILEQLAQQIQNLVEEELLKGKLDIVMCILSNYTPECIVRAWVSCELDALGDFGPKFVKAVNIANVDTDRAVTHNKGIYNGIDSVIIATGNDFRATSACGHAYASKDGFYKSLSKAHIKNNIFTFELTIPMSLGTVGGLTTLHPLSKISLSILDNPNAKELMKIVAAMGLAQNFSAIRSLVTTGIQRGHMKMHLLNILKQLGANESEVELSKQYFVERIVSFSSVRNFLQSMRVQQ